jgi:hypothetical protein
MPAGCHLASAEFTPLFYTLKFKEKRRREKKITRIYGPAKKKRLRASASSAASEAKKSKPNSELNTPRSIQLAREIKACRRLRG